MNKRTRLVCGGLIAAWIILVAWQIIEHDRVKQVAKVALINRAKDISTSLGVVIRSQRRFGVIPVDRIESALNALIKPGELDAIALLNSAGEVVASAGARIDFDTKNFIRTGEYWRDRSVALMNLVDLGTNVTSEVEATRPTIIVPPNPFGTNRPPPPPETRPSHQPDTEIRPAAEAAGTSDQAPSRRGRRWPRGPGGERPPFGRPFWMSEPEYQAAIEKQGVHSFVAVLSTAPMRDTSDRDFWLRFIISGLAAVSALGLGLAWRSLNRSSELELRLVRSAEVNTRLKEMNLAAAGLAHETKNPLNIIRGLAQMISKQEEAPPEIRSKSVAIIDEADRVTAQLNEFINYSRPREVRRSPVPLQSVISEIVRALSYDLEEKAVQLQIQDDLPRVEADDQLLRQALFNLLLNAIQAVDRNGEIRVVVLRHDANDAMLEIRDNGPGVPPEHRQNIFRPYFTTNQKGTGMGLAVVQQIVLAHGWEIHCLPNEPRGAIFRISHLRLASNS